MYEIFKKKFIWQCVEVAISHEPKKMKMFFCFCFIFVFFVFTVAPNEFVFKKRRKLSSEIAGNHEIRLEIN